MMGLLFPSRLPKGLRGVSGLGQSHGRVELQVALRLGSGVGQIVTRDFINVVGAEAAASPWLDVCREDLVVLRIRKDGETYKDLLKEANTVASSNTQV